MKGPKIVSLCYVFGFRNCIQSEKIKGAIQAISQTTSQWEKLFLKKKEYYKILTFKMKKNQFPNTHWTIPMIVFQGSFFTETLKKSIF